MMYKCMPCCSDYVAAKQEGKPPEEMPRLNDAITEVPTWQEKIISPGSVAFFCVTVPVCLEHIQVERNSQLDTGGAVLLDGRHG